MKKRCIGLFFMLLFLTAFSVTVSAEDASLPRIVDEANLLTEQEETTLNESIRAIADTYNFDVVLLAVNSIGDKSAEAFADDYFDYQGYGYGENRDGVLFLISMEYSDWYISTRGYGITAFTDYGLEQLEEQVLPYLSDGQYYDAFGQVLSISEEYLQYAASGTPYDVPPRSKAVGMVIVVIIGLAAAFIITAIEKSSMKSVTPQVAANQYLVPGSFALGERADLFLYGTTTKTKKPEPQSSSSGGSTTHQSSSGATHGGRGGKF